MLLSRLRLTILTLRPTIQGGRTVGAGVVAKIHA
jgi:hypothetical protein